jgi:hypothetical protein
MFSLRSMMLLATAVAAAHPDLDRARAALPFPRPHLQAAHPQAIRSKLNRQLVSSSDIGMPLHRACDDFGLEELNSLLLELIRHRVHELTSGHGRQARHVTSASLRAEIQREAHDLAQAPDLQEPIRHGKCHEIAMQWVHHLDTAARAKLAHLRLPLLPPKGTHEHAPELLRGGHHAVLDVLAKQTSCQTGHAFNAEARGNWTPSLFPTWPFEVTYKAQGYGPYPFWAANTPGGGSVSGAGKQISVSYSAVLNSEKFDHLGGCSLKGMQLGWKEDAPCTTLMLGSKYNYLYDDEHKSCCVVSTPNGGCPLTPMKRDFYKLFKLQGSVSNFTAESGSYSGSVKKYGMHIYAAPDQSQPFHFWYITDDNGVPVEQGEGGCQSCIAEKYGKSSETSCSKVNNVDGKRECEVGPKFLFHQYNRTTFKSTTLDASVFNVPEVCRNTTYTCPVTPTHPLCSSSVETEDLTPTAVLV